MNDIRRWMTLCETSPLAVKAPDDIDPNVKVVLPTVYRGVEAGTDAQRAVRMFRGGDLGDGVYVTAKEWLAKTYGGGPQASVKNRRRVVHAYRLDALYPEDVAYLFGAATGGQPVSLVSGNGIELWRGPWSGGAIERALRGHDIALVIGTPNSIGVNQIAVRHPNLLHPLDATPLHEGRMFTVDGMNGPIKVYTNPAHALFERLLNASQYGVLRGQLEYMGDLYVWDAALGTHEDVERQIGGGERVAMNRHVLVAYLGLRDAEDGDADPEVLYAEFKDNPNVRRAFGGIPQVGDYHDFPELHI